MGTYRRRGFFRPASYHGSGTLGTQVPSASGRYGKKAYVCLSPRVLVLVPEHPRTMLRMVREKHFHLLLVAAATSRQHQRSHFAKEARPILCQAPAPQLCLTAPGTPQLTGCWKWRRQQPSGLVGMLHWLQGLAAACCGTPTQTPAFPDLLGDNIILPNASALVTGSAPAPRPSPT